MTALVVLSALVLALRGAAAVGVLVALAGGLPRVVQVGLAVATGLWSVAIAGDVTGMPLTADAALWLVAARELVIGATIGLLAALPLLAVAMAGRLVDRADGARSRGPYGALFSVLAAAVFVGIDGHVALVGAIATSFAEVPAVAVTQSRVVASVARLVPIAVQLAIPWLVTAVVVEIAAGVAVRLAGRAAGHGPLAAATPAALVMMTASLIGTLAVAIAQLVR
jgi:type III secretory pathway component EscT